MNPLELSGPEFLALAVPLLLVTFVFAKALRWWMRQPGDPLRRFTRDIGPYEAAALRGREAVVDAALASLAHQKLLGLGVDHLEAVGKVPFNAPLAERLVHAAVSEGEVKSSELLERAEPAIQQLRRTLLERGWLVDDAWSLRARWLPMLPLVAVLLMCVAKLMVGLEQGRPVGFLVFILIFGVIACIQGFKAPWRSRSGDTVLRQLLEEQEPLKETARSATSASALSTRDMAFAVGLYGLTAVGYTEFELMRRQMASSGYTSSSSVDGVAATAVATAAATAAVAGAAAAAAGGTE
ncbi:TIGR04222 domain-containing membrane protein, partial [Pyxidicoccus sp. 3LG]